MALNISTPIRCRGCGTKFARSRANERKCIPCKRPSERARMAAARPTAPSVPARLTVRKGFPRDEHCYTTAEREQAVSLALNVARTAARAVPDSRGADGAMLRDHVADLTTYARSVANGVVPGRTWQTVTLGFLIRPCDGRRNRHLMPRPDGVETLTDARMADAAQVAA